MIQFIERNVIHIICIDIHAGIYINILIQFSIHR